jgi:hypothetical protein
MQGQAEIPSKKVCCCGRASLQGYAAVTVLPDDYVAPVPLAMREVREWWAIFAESNIRIMPESPILPGNGYKLCSLIGCNVMLQLSESAKKSCSSYSYSCDRSMDGS